MKHKILYMSALLAVTAVTPAAAQIETGQDSLVNVAFRKVAADDVLGGVSSIMVTACGAWMVRLTSLQTMFPMVCWCSLMVCPVQRIM